MANSNSGWKHRNTVVIILFIIWVTAYLDRMVMATAIPYIFDEFGLTPVAMGGVMSAFFVGYALCQIPGGLLADRFGAQKVMFSGIAWWSVFTAITGFANNLVHMLLVRVAFGVGEGIFPAASYRTISNWFPAKDRGTATGLMMSSNAFGPALAPLFVVAIMAAWGWRMVFYSLFIPGIIMCLLIKFFIPDNPADSKGISQAELDELKEDHTEQTAQAKISFWQIIKVPAVWRTFVSFFFFDITLWGFLSWLPSYLVKARGFEMTKMGITASMPFFAGTAGVILFCWLSDKYFTHNRKMPVIITQIPGAIFLYLTFAVPDATMAIICETLSGFFLYGAFGALMALPMSSISSEITGRAMGFVNMAGQIAGFLSPIIIGYLIQLAGGSFGTSFACLVGATVVSVLVTMTIKEDANKKEIHQEAVAE